MPLLPNRYPDNNSDIWKARIVQKVFIGATGYACTMILRVGEGLYPYKKKHKTGARPIL